MINKPLTKTPKHKPTLKITIFEHLIHKDVNIVAKLLDRFGLQFVETNRPPWFDLKKGD